MPNDLTQANSIDFLLADISSSSRMIAGTRFLNSEIWVHSRFTPLYGLKELRSMFKKMQQYRHNKMADGLHHLAHAL